MAVPLGGLAAGRSIRPTRFLPRSRHSLGVQAVVLTAKLRRLEEWNDERRAAAELYGDLLKELDQVRVPEVVPGNEHVWHLYVVRVPRRIVA